MIRLAAFHVVLAALRVAALVAHVVPGASAAPATSRVVDRTLRCTAGAHGGTRVIYLRAQSAFGQGATLEWLANASVSTPGQPLPSKPDYRPTLAGVSAGWPPPPPLSSNGLGFENRKCTATRAKVAFSRRGLTGGVATQLGDDYTCIVPRALLVRVRAVFREPVTLKPIVHRSFYAAEGRIEQGQISVQTLAGKPLVYTDVAGSGRARLLTAKGCS